MNIRRGPLEMTIRCTKGGRTVLIGDEKIAGPSGDGPVVATFTVDRRALVNLLRQLDPEPDLFAAQR